jgi:hypothetical protein
MGNNISTQPTCTIHKNAGICKDGLCSICCGFYKTLFENNSTSLCDVVYQCIPCDAEIRTSVEQKTPVEQVSRGPILPKYLGKNKVRRVKNVKCGKTERASKRLSKINPTLNWCNRHHMYDNC